MLVLLHGKAAAQEQRHQFSLSAGRQITAMLDEQASPLVYEARAWQAGLSYERRGQRSRLGVQLLPAIGITLPERFGVRHYGNEHFSYTVESAYYNLEAEVLYLRLLNKTESRLKLFAGGALSNSLGISDAIANFYAGTNIAALDAQVQLEYKPTLSSLFKLRAGVPIAAAVTRHIYANYPKSAEYNNLNSFFRQGTRPALPDELQRVTAQLSYQHSLSRRFALGASYRFSWFHYPYSRPVRAYSQAFTIQSIVQF